jgi:cyclic beta-1,2-glucan synthetase
VITNGLKALIPAASPALYALLDPARGSLQPPIRAEIFGQQRFAQHGQSLGETHRVARARPRAPTFYPRLRSNIEALREAHRYIGVQAATGYDVSPAAEWLLDNFHLIEAQLTQIREGLPRRYFRELPVLVEEPLAGLPRIYGVAWAFVAHTDGAFDEELLAAFLGAYQETRELKLSEMWALPTTLRVVLIENLRRLAERVACNKAAREAANLCFDSLGELTPAVLDEVLALLERRGVARVFLAQMALRLQDRRPDAGLGIREEHHDWLQRALPDLAASQAQHSADQAADNLSVSNAVTSLRDIGDADWPDIVAHSSVLMRLMLGSAVFEAEHVATRDQTLHGIERLSRRSGLGELLVAQQLLTLMRAAPAGDALASVPSHWLLGAGRPALLQSLGLHESASRAWRAVSAQVALPAYLSALLLMTFGLLAWLLLRHGAQSGWAWLAVALAMAFPASESVVAVINRLISESARPRHLPRLAFGRGIPAEHRVLVVIPAMLGDPAAIDALAHRLELHQLANPEREAQFALLTDWVDADAARLAGDAALLAHAVQCVEALNRRHPGDPGLHGAPPRFIVLHRERQFSETEQRWIGWERKRGKLEQLIAALATGQGAAFIDCGEASRLAAGIRYVVTLDSDTQLPPGRLRELVGVAAHPHNQPRLDSARRRVEAGYGILQPRIVTPLPAVRDFTRFHWLFAGQCGIDPYSAASSEVYQDLFGEGSFSGKGLLHVQAVHAVLAQRLPEGQVLSHDLLEGALARCAAVTDISLIEDAPFHADVAASRVHRWTRGDWQLLPLLLAAGRYRLRAVNRWKMFDNLRRSLVAPMSLALIVLALAGVGITPLAALWLVFAAFSAGPLLGAVSGLSPHRDNLARLHFYRHAFADLVRALWGGVWHLAQLLQQALLSADAIVRALWRMAVSRRHLLQWTTAASAQAQASTRLRVLWRRHAAEPVLAALLLAALLGAGSPHPVLSIVLCLLWSASPLWTWWASRPRPPREDAALPLQDQAYLEGIARDTWRFFERCVTAGENHLPPDNLQTLPHELVAHRTSPTNIGLYLLSAAGAHEFGWIGTAELLVRLEATLATLATLQRHRGHFLNWYDTQTRAPLLPMYVSTVDSGNLGGHLLAVGQACLAFARADGVGENDARRLEAVAATCTGLAWSADYRFLYHPRRHLFHIGYRVAEQQLDAGFYDLLASESRLTSLLAIAKGDVPVGHWAALGRPFYAVGAVAGLRSWSGSMFEYLMPSLLLDEPEGSVLRDAGLAALREHISFAHAHAVPWGISESAYAGRDHTLAYQYAPQGVPRLALRRTPPEELVIAPYATGLAAQVAPRRACANFAALQALGARDGLGFIEALDYTPSRQALGESFTPVATFMSHHQGMTLVALTNVLRDGVVRRWAMADSHLEAMAPLLHERAPREVSMLYAPPAGPPPQALKRRAPGLLREVLPGAAALEPTHVLSNGRYSVSLRANGAGWSRWGAAGITRWRDDALRDALGSFFYLRWDAQPRAVSITQHPAPDSAAVYGSTYHADRVCFDASWPEVQAHTTVWVSPEDDIEFRQVELRNLGERMLDIELLSAFEVTLAEPRADEAHPAFSNLFVRAQWRPALQALVFERTPRLASERGVMAAHFLAASDPQVLGIRVQTDRQRWLGRNRGASRPLASFDAAPLSADGQPVALDTGLDPVCALAVRLRIAPGAKAMLTFATAATDNGGVLSAVIDKYRQAIHVQRASLMSATLTGIRLRELRIGAENFAAVQSLTTALVMTLTRPQRSAAAADAGAACDRRLLWRFGISGDRPIVLVSARVSQGLGLLRSLAQALRLWSWGGVACDLVVVNAEPASYVMALQHELSALRERHAADSAAQGGVAHTGFVVLQAHEVSADELATLRGLARIRLQADGRPLLLHVQEWIALHEDAFERRHEVSSAVLLASSGPAAPVPAPTGSFTPESGEFGFEVSAQLRPQRPWINVIANAGFGTQVSEAGGGYTWAGNSRLHQLTAWSNDAVADPPSEWLLLQDLRTRQTWSATPSAWGSPDDEQVSYRVVHGQGYSVIWHRRGDAEVRVTWCVDPLLAVKQVQLRIVNRGTRTLRLRMAGIVEWAMGAGRADRGMVHTALVRQRLPGGKLSALLCTQREQSAGFGGGTAFFALADTGDDDEDWTCDRRECFDARGRLQLPDHFGQQQGSGLDPCAALSTPVTIGAGESAERTFLLGHADSPMAARELAIRAAAVPARQRLAAARGTWDALLGATTVSTPDPLFDAMVNRWLLYQAVSCRMWAKAGFYQAGGATGFRDQLQDAMALAWAAPLMLREQILLAASRQFPEGDVQHWWHAPGGAGVRTHFSDDLLWLAVACVHYLRTTGDTALLDENVAFLEGATIPPGAEDVYDTPSVSAQSASVYEHAARAIDRSLRVGIHGLPLMGSGDWNDGMNRVGHEGRGESVWLGWFLCQLVADFAPIARARGEADRAQRWDDAARGWQAALRGPAWDGAWFRRAFFDDGSPLGSQANAEARVDLIAQAWAVLSGVASWPQQVVAMAAVEAQLVDVQAGLVRLLDPPLAHALPSAGYIQAYPPGVRENGGQYSHGAVWALMAQAEMATRHGHPDSAGAAWRYFTWLSPAHRATHPRQGAVYGVEPYVMAGDVYTQPPYVGRGGWSWYTGAAAWMHRAAIESIFGLRLGAQSLSFLPCLPAHWPRAELSLQRDGRRLRFILLRSGEGEANRVAAPLAATLLRPGEALDWRGTGAQACFVIPLGDAPA